MCKLNILDKISFILCILGGITFGIIALTNVNVIAYISFGSSMIQRIIYLLFFLGSIDLVVLLFRCKYLFDQI